MRIGYVKYHLTYISEIKGSKDKMQGHVHVRIFKKIGGAGFTNCNYVSFVSLIYKKYGVVCSGGISRSVFGTALKILTSRSVDVPNFKIDATFPQR